MTRTAQAWQFTLVGLLAVAALLVPVTAAAASGSAEASFVAKVNAERTQRGLPALGVDGQLAQVARDWSAQMVANGGISHRPNLRAVVSGDHVGENVGRSALTGAGEAQLVERLHRAFMSSPGHRQNVLGDWTHVGVGVQVTGGGEEMWVTVNFKAVAPAAAPAAVPEPAPEPEREQNAAAEPAPTPESDDDAPAEPDVATSGDEVADEPTAPLARPARDALPAAVRAYFALTDPPSLHRQLAGGMRAI